MVPTGTEAGGIIIIDADAPLKRHIDTQALVGRRVTVTAIALGLGGCWLHGKGDAIEQQQQEQEDTGASPIHRAPHD